MNKKLLIGGAIAVAGVGILLYLKSNLYKNLKDKSECKKFTNSLGYDSDFAKEYCKDKNWKSKPLPNPSGSSL